MVLRRCAFGFSLLAFSTLALGAGPAPPPPAATTTTTAPGLIMPGLSPVAVELRQWAAAGTAAGNVGDFYDNRDRTHSLLDLKMYPQLTPVLYTEAEKKANADWGAAARIAPVGGGPLLGNSSTSAEPAAGGSNPRLYYSSSDGLKFLFLGYVRSQLYVYPCHHDHLPGHNGNPLIDPNGYGDLYPANTPYLLISQGSSFTDQPFMQAVVETLAAFRPEVKRKLIDSGMLMATVQMVLRSSLRGVVKPEDYLTAVAHPVVFSGGDVDALRMIRLAHSITLDNLPPVAEIKLLEEDTAVPGCDYFEACDTETYASSPCAIERIYRTTAARQRVVLSVAGSGDLNKKPLQFTWVVLQGDRADAAHPASPSPGISIKPLDPAALRAEITIPYHPRAPIAPGSAMESNRVDIAVFANNGTFYSAPAFLTNFTLDNEARTYDAQGRILEVGYAMGESYFLMPDPMTLLDALSLPTPPAKLAPLVEALMPAQRAALKTLPDHLKPLAIRLAAAQLYLRDATASKVEKDIQTAQKNVNAAQQSYDESLRQSVEGLPHGFRRAISEALVRAASDPTFTVRYAPLLTEALAKASPETRSQILAERQRLVAYGIIEKGDGSPLHLAFTPLRPPALPAATGPAATGPSAAKVLLTEQLTAFEQACLVRYQGDLLAVLAPEFAQHNFRFNFVDSRIAGPKSWRDVYHYDDAGDLTGWTRYDLGARTEFTAQGDAILERDATGRCVKAARVTYSRVPGQAERGAENYRLWVPVVQTITKETFDYVYDGPTDHVGHRPATTAPPLLLPPIAPGPGPF